MFTYAQQCVAERTKKNWYVKIHSRRAVPNKVGEGH